MAHTAEELAHLIGDCTYEQAKVMLAAPDLLEALEQLADEQALFAPQLPPIYAERLENARAAIEAAKGD